MTTALPTVTVSVADQPDVLRALARCFEASPIAPATPPRPLTIIGERAGPPSLPRLSPSPDAVALVLLIPT